MAVGATRTARGAMPPRATPPAPARRRWTDPLVVLCTASLLVVVLLWVSNGGLGELAGLPDGLTSLGRLTGLLAADLLLIQVLLMARLPWLERSHGQDQLARWHRLAGFTSFNLILAHIVLITLGYAGSYHTGVLREAWRLLVTYPGMLLAAAATAALILVVVTSLRAARRRLRYSSWHLLHLYAYLGAGLAIPHEIWTGQDFVSCTAAQVYWWTIYAVAAGSVLVFRLGVPLWRSALHRLVVAEVVAESPGVVSVYLRGRLLHRLPVRAGQFFQWRFLTGAGWSRAHPYSLSAAPGRDRLRITVKERGTDTSKLRELSPGTRVLVEGPYGKLTAASRRTAKVTMLASGIGITPLRALLEELPYRPGDATLIYRARDPADFAFRHELDQLAARRGSRVHYLSGPRAGPDAWAPAGYGPVDGLLARLVPGIAGQDVFICGPDQWMATAAEAARRAGVPNEHIHLEYFSW